MKKLILFFGVMGLSIRVFADTKLSALVVDSTAVASDLVYKVDTVGSNVSRSITLGNLMTQVAVSSLSAINPNPGSFGNTTQTSSITVNAQGRITGAANVTITPAAASITAGSLLNTVIASSLTPSGVIAGSYGNTTQVTTFTVTAQGLVTNVQNITLTPAAASIQAGSLGSGVIASSGTPLNLFAGTSRLPTANQSFIYYYDPTNWKLLSPGTTAFPTLDNSTTTTVPSAYWIDATTQAITKTFAFRPYGGASLYQSFVFGGSTVTSGNVKFTTYLTCNTSVDNQVLTYTLDVSTSGAVPGTANSYTTLENGPLTLNGCTEGKMMTVLMTRNHNVGSDAAGQIRQFPGAIYEK